jgi:exonuclease VII small subunit
MSANPEKQKNVSSYQRGWDALEKMLRELRLTEAELEEARDSFCKGINLLSGMFLSQFMLEKRK